MEKDFICTQVQIKEKRKERRTEKEGKMIYTVQFFTC